MRVKILGLVMALMVIISSFSVLANEEQFQFQAEVGRYLSWQSRLMDIIINSLYTQK